MPPLVAAAIVTGAAGVGTAAIGAHASGSASKRATDAQTAAAAKAEAFEREQDTLNRAEAAKRDAEDQRRWEVDQANKARVQAEADARQKMLDARQNYEDQQRYRKMVNLARLTGGPVPDAPPPFGAPADGTYAPMPTAPAGAPLLARPSTANAMIAAPGQFDPFAEAAAAQQGIPLSALSRRRV